MSLHIFSYISFQPLFSITLSISAPFPDFSSEGHFTEQNSLLDLSIMMSHKILQSNRIKIELMKFSTILILSNFTQIYWKITPFTHNPTCPSTLISIQPVRFVGSFTQISTVFKKIMSLSLNTWDWKANWNVEDVIL